MPESLIIGYGISLDSEDRVLLLRRRDGESLWPGQWWLPGDVTPLSEDPDETVPRVFEHLLRQRVRASYGHTVYGEEPSSGRHAVHNAYLVAGSDALDPAPADEVNPFDAMEWWSIESALNELPQEQALLLWTVIERRNAGWDFDDNSSFGALFDDDSTDPSGDQSPLPPRVQSLIRLATFAALHDEAGLQVALDTASGHGWSEAEIEHALAIASALRDARESITAQA